MSDPNEIYHAKVLEAFRTLIAIQVQQVKKYTEVANNLEELKQEIIERF